jgi:two-component system sensor kinase FixL
MYYTSEKDQYRKFVKDRLSLLTPVFANASIGNFSSDVLIPEEEDEFSGLFAGIHIMVQVIREQLSSLNELNHSLEETIDRRTSEVLARDRALRENEEKLLEVITNSSNLFYTHDTNHVLSYISPQCRQFFGIEPDQTNRKWTEFTTDHPINKEGLRITERAIATGERQPPYELELYGKNGRKIWVSVSEAPVIREGRTVAITGALTDISEKKRADETRQQLLKDLEASNEELSNYAHIVSHDLKSPLRAIGMLSELLLQENKEALGESGRNYFNLIIENVRRMHGLIDGVLKYSRVGRERETRVMVDLNEVVMQISENMQLENKVEVHLLNRLPEVYCEPVRITQVFQNLIDNAVKFMDKPIGIIEISSRDAGNHWRISVADNGPGIEKRYFEKIFQIFQTISSQNEPASSGVGLSIVKKIIDLYQGKIWVESEPGNGSVFHFTLPKGRVE